MSLDMNKWKEFRFGNLLENKNIYKAKVINKDDLTETKDLSKGIRYITRTSDNNGCAMLALFSEIDTSFIEEGNAITIGDTTATCFYQVEKFITGDHIVVIRADWLNETRALYILAILNNEQYKYSYGRAFLIDRIKDTMIKLPAIKNENGFSPDWCYMDKYINRLRFKPLTTKNRSQNKEQLSIDQWEEFYVFKILKMYNGKGITKEEIGENPGKLNVVQSGEENNGLLGKIDIDYCRSMQYTMTEKSCLTVARTGSAGFVSFQVEGCVVGDSAKILVLEDNVAKKGVYLFIQTVLMANRFKYAYGRKVTEVKYLNDIIKLPIKRNKDMTPYIDETQHYSDKGYVPDWGYMDGYIKHLPYGDRLDG